jgi:hypothetical protein
MTWTQFWDMHSGGGLKESPYSMIYIEAPEAEARVIFYNRFGHNPSRVSCTCCGDDYSVDSEETLERLTGYHRNCDHLVTPRDERGRYTEPDDAWFKEHYYVEPEDVAEAKRRGWTVEENTARKIGREHGSDFGRYLTVEQYLAQPNVLVVRAADITPEQRVGEVRAQGYVWVE